MKNRCFAVRKFQDNFSPALVKHRTIAKIPERKFEKKLDTTRHNKRVLSLAKPKIDVPKTSTKFKS